jgi:DNA ligase 1
VSLPLSPPVQPQLAKSARELPPGDGWCYEPKWDGFRTIVFRDGDDVQLQSRNGRPMNRYFPEIVEQVLALPADRLVLDGEAIALRADGAPHPFQVTMRRFGRKLDVDALRRELPLAACYFDCLFLDGETLIDRPARDRFAALADLVPAGMTIPQMIAADPAGATRFMEAARRAGHEGLLAKALDAPYDAGRRGAGWLKVKPVHTLDLVVLAAEWGSGRRRGWLSNLHLGCYDPDTDSFVMLGKTFKGLTDELLTWQTEALLAREVRRERHVVHVRPELVVEIAFDGLVRSPQEPGVE